MNKIALALVTVLSIVSSGAFAVRALAAPGGQQPNNQYGKIEIDTQEVPNPFQYANSALKRVVQTQLVFVDTQNVRTPYENLWYSNATPLGLNRLTPLNKIKNLNPGEKIDITVVHLLSNPAPPDEQQAAAKAALKAIVDLSLNNDFTPLVIVPRASFQTIASQFGNYLTPESDSGVDQGNPYNFSVQLVSPEQPPVFTQTFVHYD